MRTVMTKGIVRLGTTDEVRVILCCCAREGTLVNLKIIIRACCKLHVCVNVNKDTMSISSLGYDLLGEL